MTTVGLLRMRALQFLHAESAVFLDAARRLLRQAGEDERRALEAVCAAVERR
ncbi:hypothetical protein [Streptomyces sp. 1331.2]|uniref:hypothetical protein n=1 Tax=Streptomyces sp. 1331.2 TaxID=1938835 RepID=UPI000BCEBE1C|nr:hypothetical protein [Streptomyces sp. 1331.2]SOB85209.1 hypothetical protein SAMN06272789_5483 [Streptomyces sp. 1331.2]